VALQKTHPSDPNDNTKQNSHAVAAVNYGLILFLQQQQQQQQPQQQQVSAGCLSETLPVLSKTKGQCMQQVSDQGTTLHYCIPIFCLASITLCVVWLLSPYACQCLHLELRWSAHHGLHKDSRGSE
jgi:hypothetical protein